MPLTIFPPRQTTLAVVRRWIVPALFAAVGVALAVRVAAFLLLPNVDGDAYCYLDKARELRAALLAGGLRLENLFFFWLPLYPLVVALVSLVFPGGGHLMLVGKLVSAASGLVACWLTYRLLVAMTRRPLVALAGALCVAFDPWQLLYSSNSMTELPFEALVLGALDRVIARRWTAASVLLVLAGFVRIEAWPLAALVPVAAFLTERKIRLMPILLVCVAPMVWLAISYAAKGDARAYFTIRNAYVAEYLAYEPARAHLTARWAQWDFSNLRQGACVPAVLGAFAAMGTLAGRFLTRRRPGPATLAPIALAVVYGFLLAFLLAAYATRSQPVLWVRYGLVFQPLGVCLTLWWLTDGAGVRLRGAAALLLGAGIVAHAAYEFKVINDTRGSLLFQRQAGALLAALHPGRVYCDSIVVRVEAGLMPGHTCASADLRRDPDGFLADLHRQGVDYLVYIASEASTPVKLFPELADFRAAHGLEPFRKIASPDWRPAVLIYRVVPPNQTTPETVPNGG